MVMSRRRTERFAPDDFEKVVPLETGRVRDLYSQGVVRQIWLRADLPGACFLVEATTFDQARAIVEDLPMATSGLSAFKVIPLRPYPGFWPR